jgi:hypothetical protein
MPLVTQCTALGCETLTMGPFCVEHDALPVREFVRGRPLVSTATHPGRTPSGAVPARPNVVRRASERPVADPLLR